MSSETFDENGQFLGAASYPLATLPYFEYNFKGTMNQRDTRFYIKPLLIEHLKANHAQLTVLDMENRMLSDTEVRGARVRRIRRAVPAEHSPVPTGDAGDQGVERQHNSDRAQAWAQFYGSRPARAQRDTQDEQDHQKGAPPSLALRECCARYLSPIAS